MQIVAREKPPQVANANSKGRNDSGAMVKYFYRPERVISASIRGLVLPRNSINQLKKAMLHSVFCIQRRPQLPYGTRKILLVKGSFTSVPGGTHAHRPALIGGVRALHEARFTRTGVPRDNRPWPVLTARQRWAVVLRVGGCFGIFRWGFGLKGCCVG